MMQETKTYESLPSFLLFMSVFAALNTVNPLIKICINRILLKSRLGASNLPETTNLSDNYWSYFVVDFITYQLPIILYVTVLSQTLAYLGVLIVISLICCRIAKITCAKIEPSLEEADTTIDNLDPDDSDELDASVVKISVHSFRTLLFVITSVAILAVDFRSVFPRRFAKTVSFGFSLMDVGVGYFILGHAMRLIRNAEPLESLKNTSFQDELSHFSSKFYQTVKKSSLLLLLGLVRLALVKLTNYEVSTSEYGLHWNFFFTIFFVKVLASPIELVIRKSSFRALLVSLLIGGVYQYFLICYPQFSYYIISNFVERETLIDANKEGIFSLFGYLSIYFAGVSVCHRLVQVLSESRQEKEYQLSKAFKCVSNLGCFAIVFLLLAEFTRVHVQNISRKMCNLGFVFFIMSTCTALWALALAGISLITIFLVWIAKRSKSNGQSTSRRVLHLQDTCFSFVKIMDSKLVGLAMFLIANLFTGLVNLSIESKKAQPSLALAILAINSLVSSFLPFLAFYVNKRFCVRVQTI